jgi:hypothetical protein
MHNKLNPKKPKYVPSKLENCQNLKINDPKLIAFANKCFIDSGKNLNDYTPPKITDFIIELPKLREKFSKLREKSPELWKEFPEFSDRWVVSYCGKEGCFGNHYEVRISSVTCKCEVEGIK